MTKFEVQPAADETLFDHAAAPSRAVDLDQHRIRTIDGMAGNPSLPIALAHDRVHAIPRLDFEHGARWEVPEMDATFYFRLNQIPVDLVAQIRVRFKKSRNFYGSSHADSDDLTIPLDHVSRAVAASYFGQFSGVA
jgi:hypothetical protein